MTPNEAIELGYCIVSSTSPPLIARIDRPDWREHMANTHTRGMDWVLELGTRAADRYRRSYSKDVHSVHVSWVAKLPQSDVGPQEYIKGPADAPIPGI